MPRFKIVNGIEVQLTSEEKIVKDAEEKQAELDRQEYLKVKYIEDRAREFPSYGDQLDYIFHHGIEKWKTDIVQPVKEKYPKPT